jgi:hypothetical protein
MISRAALPFRAKDGLSDIVTQMMVNKLQVILAISFLEVSIMADRLILKNRIFKEQANSDSRSKSGTVTLLRAFGIA